MHVFSSIHLLMVCINSSDGRHNMDAVKFNSHFFYLFNRKYYVGLCMHANTKACVQRSAKETTKEEMKLQRPKTTIKDKTSKKR